jgi:NAD(P)-dependent dehydrogenase (short-subunit alcohol dehydrogenase family)
MSSSQVDLTDEAAVAVWASDVAAEHGQVHILYANAAVTRFAPVEELTFADWKWNVEHEMDVVFLPVKYFWPQLIEADNAAIVLVGSTAGVTGSMTNGRLAHTATKGAVVAMTRQLAAEGAPHGLRVNAVSPGMIRTAATEGNLLAADHPMRTSPAAFRWAGSEGRRKWRPARCSLPPTKRPTSRVPTSWWTAAGRQSCRADTNGWGRQRRASETDLAPPWDDCPPSTGISAPVTKDESGLSRKSTTAATSSTLPVRPSGVSLRVACRNSGFAPAVMGVSMKPGWTVLTRMPRGPSSSAATWESPRSAHLLAV